VSPSCPESLPLISLVFPARLLAFYHVANKIYFFRSSTSSVASIQNANDQTPGKVWTEADWNTFSVEEIEKKGDKAAGFHKYKVSI